jgi:CHAT domain-containing protein
MISALRLSMLNLTNTKLVVLSACRSALGEIRNGEGVAGLNQALFTAGAQCVISGLWAVADDETAEFMAAFYRQLVNGKTSAMALREAKLEFSQRHTPHHWAGFVLHGESIKLETDTSLPNVSITPLF